MSGMELLAPAGSLESVYAAVQNGADAVYMGYGEFNARRNARNLSEEDMRRAVEYCRLRDVKTYITLNILVSDREMNRAVDYIRDISRLGADAMIVQDLGLARVARQVAPDLPLHASTQMTIHNLEGAQALAALGFERVVAARELRADDLRKLCRESPIGIEVFAHGALCMCYSGQCYMSAVIGRRSGNRGLCAQPCRLPYAYAGEADTYHLSLKDLCMAPHLSELARMGVCAVKIEGRMKRPEYTGFVTGVYSRALRSGSPPGRRELEQLRLLFSRDGFTDGYYTGKTGESMFGVRAEAQADELSKLYEQVRSTYEHGDINPCVALRCAFTAKKGQKITLSCEDSRGNSHTAHGDAPEEAIHRVTTRDDVVRSLGKTGGTPFYVDTLRMEMDDGLAIPLSALNALRRECLEHIAALRTRPPERQVQAYRVGVRRANPKEPPCLNVSIMSFAQVTDPLLACRPALLYLPLAEAAAHEDKLSAVIGAGQAVAVTMPRIIAPHDVAEVRDMLERVYRCGVREALAGNLGHLLIAHEAGFRVRGDYGLNIYNSESLRALRKYGCLSAALSFELRFAQIRDLSKGMDTEIIAYGRLPLMVFENCLIKARNGRCVCDAPQGLTDRRGQVFPLVPEYGCRNQLLNSSKLFLADRRQDYRSLGLWAVRLQFTTENPRECAGVTEAYLGRGGYAPADFTRGLYYRGVD